MYNGLYFSSIRILKVLKGKVHKKLRRHVRLVFRVENNGGGGDNEDSRRKCNYPVSFGVRSGRKYLLFLKRLGHQARYAAVARPVAWSKQTKRIEKRMLCDGCGNNNIFRKITPYHRVL